MDGTMMRQPFVELLVDGVHFSHLGFFGCYLFRFFTLSSIRHTLIIAFLHALLGSSVCLIRGYSMVVHLPKTYSCVQISSVFALLGTSLHETRVTWICKV